MPFDPRLPAPRLAAILPLVLALHAGAAPPLLATSEDATALAGARDPLLRSLEAEERRAEHVPAVTVQIGSRGIGGLLGQDLRIEVVDLAAGARGEARDLRSLHVPRRIMGLDVRPILDALGIEDAVAVALLTLVGPVRLKDVTHLDELELDRRRPLGGAALEGRCLEGDERRLAAPERE